jgi:uncharacterized membrane protein
MATKRQEIRINEGDAGEKEHSLASSSKSGDSEHKQQPTTRGAQPNKLAQPNKPLQQNGGQPGGLRSLNEEQLARGLGWFSIGLGLAELLAPRGVAKIAGVRGDNNGLIRMFGLREIASGVAIFMQGKRPAAAVWSRVAGDALDIAALGVAFASSNSRKGRVAFATANVLGVTALDVICAQQLSRNPSSSKGGAVQVKKSIIINSSPEEVYQFWRNFENLPRFMYHLESVRAASDGRSHWVAKAPAGKTVEWDAEIIEDRPNELISWRSLDGADVDNNGSVRFERGPGGRGTVVRVELDYSPPGGVVGAGIAKLFGEEPEQQIKDDLRRFKQVIETGEVVRSDGSPQGMGAIAQHPGQPLASGAGK